MLLSVLSANSQEVIEADYELQVENNAVHKYLEEVVYEPHGASVVDAYREGVSYRMDYPSSLSMTLPLVEVSSTSGNPSSTYTIVCCDDQTLSDSLTFEVASTAGEASLCNFIPNRTYRYQVLDGETLLKQGKIHTSGQMRMITIPGTNLFNIRDIGGWKTVDNKRIKYGKILRGCELNGSRIATNEGIELLRQLGVEAEIDMRAFYNTHNISAFGFLNASQTPAGEVATYYYTDDSGQLPEHMSIYKWQYRWRKEFEFIVNNLRKGRCVYEHCVSGKDRTGFLSFLLEGLLGVPYNELVKDYELSYFAYHIESTKETIDKVFDYINGLDGETLRDKFNHYFKNVLYVSQDNIDYFRTAMLEDVVDDGVVTFIEPADCRICTDGYDDVWYDLHGRQVRHPQPGLLYLQRTVNGRTRKVFCR